MDADLMDNAYGGLAESDLDGRWAFGGGFDDPFAGLATDVPAEVAGPALAAYCLALADDALVLAQRLLQWCTRAPELEEEVALANFALDLLGQARLLYARAAVAERGCVPRLPEGSPVPDEDRLAFFRGPQEFRCVRLVQLPDRDFADAVVRLAVFAVWRHELLERLRGSADPVLAAVAAKAVKEVRYHRSWAVRWLLVLAGGTEESRRRTTAALARVLPWTSELGSHRAPADLVSASVAPDPAAVVASTTEALHAVLDAAGLNVPEAPGPPVDEGWLAPLLEEMQSIARAHPQGRW